MARPLKGQKALTQVRSFRLDEEAASGLDAICAEAGITPSEFVRECQRLILQGLEISDSEFFRKLASRTKAVARPKASDTKERLLFLANKTSNNVNQLAYRANVDALAGKVSEATYTAILGELDAITRYMTVVANHVD